MNNGEQTLKQVGDTNVWYDPVTGVNYIKTDACGGGFHPMVDRFGQPVIDKHEKKKKAK